MDPNREDDIDMRVVGSRRVPSALSLSDSRAQIVDWRRAFPTPFVPKGVYRFKTHEEADRWLWEMLTRPQAR